jgi:hypothetical protein
MMKEVSSCVGSDRGANVTTSCGAGCFGGWFHRDIGLWLLRFREGIGGLCSGVGKSVD